MRKGFTFVELLVSLIILTLTFQIVFSVVFNIMESYKISKVNMQNLYAESYVSLLYDILENELKYAGSGGELLKNLYKPSYVLGNVSSYIQKGEKYSEITDHIWLANSIDVKEDTNKLEFYVTYVVTYKNFFVRNADGTYSPLFKGYVGDFRWAIIKNKLSPSTEGYFTRFVKLDVEKISGPDEFPGIVGPEDTFKIEEINLADQTEKVMLGDEDKYIYPLSRNTLTSVEFSKNLFRQIKVVFEKNTGKIYIEKFFPILDLTKKVYRQDILENVKSFEVYALYYPNGEKRLSEIKNQSFDLSSIYALKFLVTWSSPWKFGSKNFEITKTRVILLIPNL
ncbi:N-terminal cleavage protein [Thermosipho affectus]|uniref:N-terminal cleavage protein n=1 Tax=Thermosipho affectus TaxID=660294 RepID=A0ABX3IIN7_9BACT|nr:MULTISPECIES: prepilin-type N-terminal cleavage/methylation domain-containing protein [Thermosipho]ONN27184.1 N-terminal cleavage protein [Thermosipho affectus]OOC43524.1 N-terminal cleavage protein [Thermosipho sp. 1074]